MKTLLLLIALLFSNITFANTNLANDITLIKNIETYINSLQSISGNFKQISSNGATDSGVFYINKPGRMRLEYKSPILLVADGSSIVYFDKKLDQISYISLDSNPASIILNGNINLTDEKSPVKISNITKNNDILEVELTVPNEKQSGKITMIFQDKPLSLLGWKVKDAQGITTTISLYNIRPEKNLSDSLFKITRNKSFDNKKKNSKYY
ncbi:outer membrane lipoprotein carrier protein LolA [bacterium]|nr:outer membrane lipoprotein carrier protein LolA [bacterium]MDE6224420.1 outer membrane lipoprotein carrier protein LolA [Alphaproteobacteria bacterium]